MPTRGQRPRFGFAVPNYASHHEVGIIESRSVGVNEGVAKFTPFVNRTGSLGRYVAWYSTREGELPEQPA